MLRGTATDQGDVVAEGESMLEGKQKEGDCVLVVTGFGRFHGVDDNPTKRLVDKLAADLRRDGALSWLECGELRDCRVLEVSAEGASTAVEDIHSLLDKEDQKATCIVLHCGVDSTTTEFHLESAGYNEADFRCPDERGFQPTNAPILSNRGHDTSLQLDTEIDVDALATELRSMSPPWAVSVSHDPGRFVCNYTYFESLKMCHLRRGRVKRLSLFLHVPPVSLVPLHIQEGFIRQLLILLARGPKLRDVPTPQGLSATSETEAKEGVVASSSSSSSGTSASVTAVMELGFSQGDAERAVRAVGEGNVEAAVTWLIDRGDEDVPAPVASEDGAVAGVGDLSAMLSSAWGSGGVPFKLVLVVRTDLKMGVGKVASQCCHAALGAYEDLDRLGQKAVLMQWQAQGEPVIAVRCSDLPTMLQLEGQAKALGLPTHLVRDAGRTQVDPGSTTVLAVGPAPSILIDQVTGRLSLL